MKPYTKFFEKNWRDYENEGEEGENRYQVGNKFLHAENNVTLTITDVTSDAYIYEYEFKGKSYVESRDKDKFEQLVDIGVYIEL